MRLPPEVTPGMLVNDANTFPAIEGANIKRRFYDRAGHLVAEVAPDGKRKEWEFDGAGQCTTPEEEEQTGNE